MIRNYFKIAVRNISKNKTYAAINVFGLAIAFLCSTLLFLNAWFELSYDTGHPEKENIFKLYNYLNGPNGEEKTASMGYPVAPTVKSEIPFIKASTRFMWNESEVEFNGKKLDLQVNLVDADFFSVFSTPILNGNRYTPLQDPGNTVMTKYAAERLFGKVDPIGKRIKIKVMGEPIELTVSAVTEDFPENSSINFDVLARPELRKDYAFEKDDWNHQNHDVYIKTTMTTSPENVEKKLGEVLKRHQTEDSTFMRTKGYKKNSYGSYSAIKLLPITEVHFNREIGAHNGATSKTYIYTVLLISFFILAIACFNFINLNVARAFTRTKEVGVRKYLGATRKQIFMQIWGESLIICLIAVLIGVCAATFLFPEFNKLFGSHLSISFFYKPSTLIMIIASTLTISLFAGGYPAIAISRISVSGILKGNATLKKPGAFRNSLIVLQFTSACVLMAATVIAYHQFEYIRTLPLGYNKQSIISFPVTGNDGRKVLNQFRNELASQSSILSISGSDINLGLGIDGNTSKSTSAFLIKGKNIYTNWITVDYDFLKTLNIKPLRGRDFSREFPSDLERNLVVTESMAKQFGEADPIGLTFSPDSAAPPYTIVGIVPDFHLYSLHEKSEPIAMNMSADHSIRYLFIKTTGNNPLPVMKQIENTFKKILPGKEFKGSFLDENTDRWYRKEQRLSLLLGISAIIAIILSCLGLFALALLMIQQRIKEIGVRKVLGASVIHITNLLAKDFLKLVLLSLVLSTPLTWWAMSQWLRDFPYHINIGWLTFAFVGFAAILISIVTISFHTIKAAIANPIKSLRTE